MKKRTSAAFALIFIVIFAFSMSPAAAPKHSSAAITIGGSTTTDSPAWIYAPSINLSSPIEGVGVTASGAMAVPSGKTANIGWYQYGVVPGSTGTAVLDAHVFAGFKSLAGVKVGGDIYIYMASGKTYHYVVTAAKTYALSSLSPSTLFAPAVSPQLNLITCAGQLTADHSTYTERLIVSAQLV